MQRQLRRRPRGATRRWADDTFSIADVVTGGVLDSARKYDLLPEMQVLHEYLARLDAREAKQRAYAP